MRTLRWGSTGPDVSALQRRLTELGFFSAAVDGWYGSQTESAVRRFQLARRLTVDGIAGPRTHEALGLTGGQPPSPAPPTGSANRAVSLHIGVNRVDPAGYGGWSGPLSGCEADADTMRAIAQAEGLAVNVLKTDQATTHNVLGSVARIAATLQAGDFFLLTYAGHGGQVPNAAGGDTESDSMDETWCLYDRQLLDDEIEAALAAFRPGVDIVLLSDSCHSGSVYRLAADPTSPQNLETERSFAALKLAFYTDLELARPGPGDAAFATVPRPRRVVGDLVGATAGSRSGKSPRTGLPVLDLDDPDDGDGFSGGGGNGRGAEVAVRAMPFDVQVSLWTSQRVMYDDIRSRAATRALVQANGVSISGCMDNQLSQESGGHGVFTTVLERVWNGNSFTGSYEAFHRAIVSNMAPSQTPELALFGASPQQLLAKTPFNP